MHGVQRPGVDEAALGDVLGDHQVQPRARAAAEEVAGADDHAVQPACGAALQLGLHRHAQFALARAGALRRVFLQQRRHAGAEVVDVARQHEARMQPLGHRQALLEQRQQFGIPARIGRVDGMDHPLRAGGPLDQGSGIGQRDRHRLGTSRQRRGARAALLRQHAPAGGRESRHGGGAEAAGGAEDQHGGTGHLELRLCCRWRQCGHRRGLQQLPKQALEVCGSV
jgi:hypothetical protein